MAFSDFLQDHQSSKTKLKCQIKGKIKKPKVHMKDRSTAVEGNSHDFGLIHLTYIWNLDFDIRT